MPDTSGNTIAWVDLETTGLAPVSEHQILEIAIAITDPHLRVCNLGPNLIIKPNDSLNIDDFVTEMHTKSGLLQALDDGVSLKEAEQECLTFFEKYGPAGTIPLAGSSVHFDKRFIEYYMPDLYEWFHYRIIDLSTLQEVFLRWFPEIRSNAPEPRKFHRAQEDIIDSINGLRYYREKMNIGIGLKQGLW